MDGFRQLIPDQAVQEYIPVGPPITFLKVVFRRHNTINEDFPEEGFPQTPYQEIDSSI